MSSAVDAYADELAEAARTMGSAVGAYADEVVGRVSSSGAQAVEAIQTHGNSVADRLAEASRTTTERRRRVRGRGRRPRQLKRR